MNVFKFASSLLLLSLLLIACGGGGTTSKTTAPTITEFTASSSTIDAGAETTLNWVIEGTTPISTSITGLGDVTGTSAIVSPARTTTYILTAENSAGSVTEDVTITVIPHSKIKRVNSILTNYHPTFRESTAQISFYIDFIEDIQIDDLQSIKISTALDTERAWFYEGDDIEDRFYIYTRSDDTKGLGIENLTNRFLAENRSVLSLGIYNFTIIFKDSEEVSFTHNVSAPGSKETNGKNYAYTENYANASNPLADYTPMLKRARINSAALDDSASRLTVKFSVNDSRVYGGTIWMYDENGDYIGRLKDGLRDYKTGDISQYINSGTAFKTGGAVNTVAVEAPQLEFIEDGYSLDNVSSILIGLFDGFQYRGTDSEIVFNSESISAIKLVDSGPSQ